MLAVEPAPGAHTRPASLWQLFTAFTVLALQGFGGVLPVAQRQLVERLRWMSAQEFAQTLAVGQVLPGPNIVNMAAMIGDRFFGWRGAVVSVAGLILAPLVIVLALAATAFGSRAEPWMAGALRGMGIVAAGLLLTTAYKLLPALKGHPMGRIGVAAVGALTVLAVAVWRWPLAWVVLGLGGLAWSLTWLKLRP